MEEIAMNILRRITSALAALCLLFSCAAMACADEVVQLPIDFSGGMPLQEKYVKGKLTYEDPSIKVERMQAESKEFDCTYYVIDIQIADASQLRTESAGGGEKGFTGRKKVPVPVMAKRVNAAVAMDGDYFAGNPEAYVLRQGVLFREIKETWHDLLLIDEDGDFHVILAGNRDVKEGLGNTFPSVPVSYEQQTMVNGKRVINGFEFGPCIILNGEEVEAHPRSIVHPHKTQSWNRAQRICLAQVGPLQYRIVAVAHFGLSVQNFTKLVLSLGPVQTAYMFDGGDSTQIAFMNQKINNVQNNKNLRGVSDCIYFASAYIKE